MDQPELGVPFGVLKGEHAKYLRTPYEIFIFRVVKEFRNAINFETVSDDSDSRNATDESDTSEDEEPIIIDMMSYFFEHDEELLNDISDMVEFQTELADVCIKFILFYEKFNCCFFLQQILTTGELRKWNMTSMYNLMSVDELQKWSRQGNTTSRLSHVRFVSKRCDFFHLVRLCLAF